MYDGPWDWAPLSYDTPDKRPQENMREGESRPGRRAMRRGREEEVQVEVCRWPTNT